MADDSRVYIVAPMGAEWTPIADMIVTAANPFVDVDGQIYEADSARVVRQGDELALVLKVDDPNYLIGNASNRLARIACNCENDLLVIEGAETRLARHGAEPTCWRSNMRAKHLDGLRRKWWLSAVIPSRLDSLSVPAAGRPHGRDDPLEIAIIGEIGGDRYRGLAEQIRNAGDRTIRLTIDSPGGDLKPAIEIRNAVARHHRRTEAEIIGAGVASAASIIVMAFDDRRIEQNARVMVHQCSVSGLGPTTAGELRRLASLVEDTNKGLAAIVHAATGCGIGQAQEWIECETYFSSGQAIGAGLVHGLILDRPPSVPGAPRAQFRAINGPYRSSRRATSQPPLYTSNTHFMSGQKVRHQGSVWVANRPTFFAPGLEPGVGPDWEPVNA